MLLGPNERYAHVSGRIFSPLPAVYHAKKVENLPSRCAPSLYDQVVISEIVRSLDSCPALRREFGRHLCQGCPSSAQARRLRHCGPNDIAARAALRNARPPDTSDVDTSYIWHRAHSNSEERLPDIDPPMSPCVSYPDLPAAR